MNPSPQSPMKNQGSRSFMDMTPEQIKEMMSKIEIIPCPEYDGIRWPSFMPFRIKGAEQAIKEIMALPSKESDILICTHGKSGTHWIYEIIQMLVNKTAELGKNAKVNTMLEALPDLSILESLPSPRILDTHFQFQYLPQKHIENRCKIVHMMRNPKDVMVSIYYYAKYDIMLDLNVEWNEFFEVWMDGKIPYGTWYDYELGMEQAEKDYPGMIFTSYFEDMKSNPEKDIERLAEFLGVQCNTQMIKDIAKATVFENMQKNKFDITELLYGVGFIYRKGEIGDWKNHFTVAQNERFDAQYKEKMKGTRGPSPQRQPNKIEQDMFCFHHQFDLKLNDRDFMFYVVMMDDGRIVSSIMNIKSPGPMLYIFNINGPLEYMIPLNYNSNGITSIDSSTVAVTACNSIDMYDINNRVHLKSIVLSGIEFSSSLCGMCKITSINNNLVVGKDNSLVIIDHQTGEVVKTIDAGGISIWFLHGIRDKIFYSCGNKVNNKNIYCYNYSDDQIDIMTLPSPPWNITSLQDGSVYVTCMNGSIQHVSADGKSYKTVTTVGLTPLEKHSVISYNPKQGKLVTCNIKGLFKVFNEV